jgi:polysaccharide biosynthesis/export protein
LVTGRPLHVAFLAAFLALTQTACGPFANFLPSSGPSRGTVEDAKEKDRPKGVLIIDVNEAITRKLAYHKAPLLFSESLGDKSENKHQLAAGDVVEVTIWEAPPAALFAGVIADPRIGVSTSRGMSFPEQMIADDGSISVPFAGRITANGRLAREVEEEIALKLKGKANSPQVLLRVIRNNGKAVTVVGEVNQSIRMPLTPRGERLLDAIAAAGGVKHPINKLVVQITRGDSVHTLPLDTVIRDPKQNITLQPGDVVTAVFQNRSFTVLGATGKNEEVPFEAVGISLAQALGRSGGLNDSRADAQGVFLFRFEDPKVFEGQPKGVPQTTDGRVPVIYRANLKDPATFFSAQRFPIQPGDVLYVSNAGAAELQKFLNIVASVFYPAVVIRGITQ